MAEYIEREAIMQKFADFVKRSNNSDFVSPPTWNQAVQIVEDFHAADVVERTLFDERMAEYQEALDKANEKLAYITGTDDYYYDLEYGREQLNSDNLKPCPFCGRMPIIKSDDRYPRPECERITAYEVVCQNYDCIIYNADNKYYRTEEEAKKAWNRRQKHER